jgi:hypothetical protein
MVSWIKLTSNYKYFVYPAVYENLNNVNTVSEVVSFLYVYYQLLPFLFSNIFKPMKLQPVAPFHCLCSVNADPF